MPIAAGIMAKKAGGKNKPAIVAAVPAATKERLTLFGVLFTVFCLN